MRHIHLVLFVFFVPIVAFAQTDSIPPKKNVDTVAVKVDTLAVKVDSLSIKNDTLAVKADSLSLKKSAPLAAQQKAKKLEPDSITIKDYKIISHERDTIFLDTALTIRKEYKYNFLRRDDFELMPFSNIGQSYNSLGKNLENTSIYPEIGARAKHFGYYETEDIAYYNVPTPMTELFFKTTFEQGQLLDAMLTFNTSRRLNFSIAYTGFRSLGKYQFDQAESGRFRTTFNYRTANNRYWVRGHYVSQELKSEENGGLLSKETQFESGDEEFIDRSRIDVVHTDANNTILGKRYFLDHQFNLVRPMRDSTKYRSTLLSIGHKIEYESRFFQFTQSRANTSFGEDAFIIPIDDKPSLKTMFNEVSATFSNKTLGAVSGNISLYDYDYFFNSLLIDESGTIQNRLEGQEISIGGTYQNQIGRLQLNGKVQYNLSGDLSGNLINASAKYGISDNSTVFASIHASSRAPNFNFLLYQSDYANFNWQNNTAFEKQQIQSITLGYDSRWFGNISAKYSAIDNYTFFASEATQEQIEAGEENAFVRPFQERGTVNYLKVKYNKEFKWRKWALNNTIMYQEVTQDNSVLNLPQLTTRNSLYFSSDVFDKAMFLQTGVTFKYFTSYTMDAYHPLLGEFFVQNREELGSFPLLDFFINTKVRQTRIYLKAEHLNTIWTKQYNYYAAPNYPYRDFVIRFGLVWNFFS